MTTATKTTQIEKIKENAKYVIKRVESGVERGASLNQMFEIISKELGASKGTVANCWYGNKNHKGLRYMRDELGMKDTMSSSKSKQSLNKKRLASDEVFKLAKETNENISKLHELYRVQGEELSIKLQEGFKKLQDTQLTLVHSTEKQNKNNIKQIESPKYNVDSNGNVKLIDLVVETFNTEQDIKINGLIDELDQKDLEIKRLNSLLEDRRSESIKLTATLKMKKEALLESEADNKALNGQIQALIEAKYESDSDVIEANRKLANSSNKLIDSQKENAKLLGVIDRLNTKENELEYQLINIKEELESEKGKTIMNRLFGSMKNVVAN